jgi:2-succinyl-6-hydroxy-2,4-cyclohexadiene-1-carboxylate synthase
MPSPIDLYFEDDKQFDKHPLLLVHGLFSSRNHWLLNEKLSVHFRLIKIDLPAHGLSPSPEDIDSYYPDVIVQSLDVLRQKLGVRRWSICGQSFGAALTLRYALNHPSSILAHIFTNANAAFRGNWSNEFTEQHESRIAVIRQSGHEGMKTLPYHPVHARRFPEHIKKSMIEAADSTFVSGILNLFQHTLPRLSIRKQFASTVVPTLLVNGVWEKAFQSTREWIEQELPYIQIVDLDGGHSINIEQPEAFNDAVRSFINSQLEKSNQRSPLSHTDPGIPHAD